MRCFPPSRCGSGAKGPCLPLSPSAKERERERERREGGNGKEERKGKKIKSKRKRNRGERYGFALLSRPPPSPKRDQAPYTPLDNYWCIPKKD